jgi:hypothetical protein
MQHAEKGAEALIATALSPSGGIPRNRRLGTCSMTTFRNLSGTFAIAPTVDSIKSGFVYKTIRELGTFL